MKTRFKKELYEFLIKDYQLKANNPDAFAKYIALSKPILEASFISIMKEHTQKALDTILKDSVPESSANTLNMINCLLMLSGALQNLQKYPSLYKSVITYSGIINELLEYPEVKQNPTLTKQLKQIIEGGDLFAVKYFEKEAAEANKSVNKNVLFQPKPLNEVKLEEKTDFSPAACRH